MKNFDKETKKAYLEDPSKCPFCKSEMIDADEFDPDGNFRFVDCVNCHKTWQELFKLTDIESLEN